MMTSHRVFLLLLGLLVYADQGFVSVHAIQRTARLRHRLISSPSTNPTPIRPSMTATLSAHTAASAMSGPKPTLNTATKTPSVRPLPPPTASTSTSTSRSATTSSPAPIAPVQQSTQPTVSAVKTTPQVSARIATPITPSTTSTTTSTKKTTTARTQPVVVPARINMKAGLALDFDDGVAQNAPGPKLITGGNVDQKTVFNGGSVNGLLPQTATSTGAPIVKLWGPGDVSPKERKVIQQEIKRLPTVLPRTPVNPNAKDWITRRSKDLDLVAGSLSTPKIAFNYAQSGTSTGDDGGEPQWADPNGSGMPAFGSDDFDENDPLYQQQSRRRRARDADDDDNSDMLPPGVNYTLPQPPNTTIAQGPGVIAGQILSINNQDDPDFTTPIPPDLTYRISPDSTGDAPVGRPAHMMSWVSLVLGLLLVLQLVAHQM